MCVPVLCAFVLGVWCACAAFAYLVRVDVADTTSLVDPGDLTCPLPMILSHIGLLLSCIVPPFLPHFLLVLFLLV